VKTNILTMAVLGGRSLRPYCSYLATTQASRLEPNCKWTAEALILTCLKGINMNGENDKLIRDFMNAFEKKGVKVLEEFFHPNVVELVRRLKV
jgi:hypothetical protein